MTTEPARGAVEEPCPGYQPGWAQGDPSGAPTLWDAASATWVRFAGRLERDSVDAVRDALTAAGLRSRLIAVDARQLTFISAPAAMAIREFSTAYSQLGGRTMIVRSPNVVDRALAVLARSGHALLVDLDADTLQPRPTGFASPSALAGAGAR